MCDNKLITLCPEKQPKQVIARLILQKSLLYIQWTERWLDEILSQSECKWVLTYAIPEDREAFKGVFDEIVDTLEIVK